VNQLTYMNNGFLCLFKSFEIGAESLPLSSILWISLVFLALFSMTLLALAQYPARRTTGWTLVVYF